MNLKNRIEKIEASFCLDQSAEIDRLLEAVLRDYKDNPRHDTPQIVTDDVSVDDVPLGLR